jgi:hypothetical protein
MSSKGRQEARSVILRLRRYRDRIDEITTAADRPAVVTPAATAAGRKLQALKNDLDHDAHECGIGRNRAVQTECEHEFLWPALREAADAIREQPGITTVDGPSRVEVSTASSMSASKTRLAEFRQALLVADAARGEAVQDRGNSVGRVGSRRPGRCG